MFIYDLDNLNSTTFKNLFKSDIPPMFSYQFLKKLALFYSSKCYVALFSKDTDIKLVFLLKKIIINLFIYTRKVWNAWFIFK